MNIVLDIDGVIIDFISSFIITVKQRLDYSLKHEDIYCHDIGQALGLPKYEIYALVNETLKRNDFKLIDQAEDSIAFLNKHHNVFLITSRDVRNKSLTEEVLAQHKISYDTIYFSSYLKKHRVNVHYDIFVEDSVAEAISLSKKGGHILLFDHPWNTQSLNMKNLFKRVYNWQEILEEIESYTPKQPSLPFSTK